ncbi:hypothetical protein [Terrisporobacter sp.]|uniref:hypothetical protein n=1 Tax=Terrisporobacter sp. TaxID=1965305 RepID=UPI002626020F|nr:hypothetical protein [Terrisporobacter sp.]
MNIYIFSSNTLTNIWAGIGANLWAVHKYEKKEFKSRAKSMPIGACGLLYCVETQSFTTPFIVKGAPKDILIKDIWPEEWMLPFEIYPIGNPKKQLHKDKLGILPIIKGKEKSWHHILHIQANTAFSPTHITEKDWSLIINKLT